MTINFIKDYLAHWSIKNAKPQYKYKSWYFLLEKRVIVDKYKMTNNFSFISKEY